MLNWASSVWKSGEASAASTATTCAHDLCSMMATGARLICSAFAFPFPTFVTFLLFATGRIMHQVGYASGPGGGGGGVGGYSSLVRVTGMILFNMLLGELPQIGFVLYAGLAAL